jgi:hypothetical protein
MSTRRPSSVVALVLAAASGLLLARCSDNPFAAPSTERYRTSGGIPVGQQEGSADARRVADSVGGNYGNGSSSDATTSTEPTTTTDESSNSGSVIVTGSSEGKGAAPTPTPEATATPTEPPATVPPDEAGKDGKGGKGGDATPTPIPTLAPTPTPTPVATATPTPAPPVVQASCPYFDAGHPSFTLAANQFGAQLPPIAVPSTKIAGEMQADGQTWIGAFTLYLYPNNIGFRLNWDGQAGRVPYDYTLVVVDSGSGVCTAYARYVKREPRTLNGCFAQGTKLRLADGTDHVISDIHVGDRLMNPVNGRAMRVAEMISGEERAPLYEIAYAGHRMLVTSLHPVPVRGGLKQARTVTTDDYVYDANGVIHRVLAARALPETAGRTVVNVRLDTDSSLAADHMVVAGGVLSGDLFLQRRLSGLGTVASGK